MEISQMCSRYVYYRECSETELFLMSQGHHYRHSHCAELKLKSSFPGSDEAQHHHKKPSITAQVLPSLAADSLGEIKLSPKVSVWEVAEFGKDEVISSKQSFSVLSWVAYIL